MNQKEIGKKIKMIRESQGLTREEFAEKLNVSIYTVANYEQGQRGSNTKVLNKIAEALGVSTDELLKPHEKAKYELENALLKGEGNILELVANYESSTKEDSIKRFHDLVKLLDWKKFRNLNDDDIYEVLMSEELYSYLDYLFFKNKNK